jgi:cytochrome c-type biogenesis protein CcmE
MHPIRRQRLVIVLLVVVGAGAAIGLGTYAMRQNINLFYPPADIVAGHVAAGKKIRAGGMVVKGSLQRDPNSLKVSFFITDFKAQVLVEYTGILPDLFAEGQGVVANGALDTAGVFQATEILAKHDENYMPPEVKDALASHPGRIPRQCGAHAGRAAAGAGCDGDAHAGLRRIDPRLPGRRFQRHHRLHAIQYRTALVL